MRSLWHRILYLLTGKLVGQVRYSKSLPFVVIDCLTKRGKMDVRYRLTVQRWTGWKWEFVENVEVTRQELRDIVKEQRQ